MERICCIYAVRCPISNEIRYVGRTCNLHVRSQYFSRKSEFNSKTNPLFSAWLKELSENNLKPIVTVLRKCSGLVELTKYERVYILKYKNQSFNILQTKTPPE